MLFTSVGQATAFLLMTHCGLAVGLAYDAARIARWTLRTSRAATLTLDIVFCAAALAITLFFWVITGENGVRAYVALGFACGVALYAAGISPWLMRVYARLQQILPKKSQKKG